MRSIVLLAIVAAGLSGTLVCANAQGTQADQTAVRNLGKKYEAAFAKGDARGVAALYTSDGVLTDASGVVSVSSGGETVLSSTSR